MHRCRGVGRRALERRRFGSRLAQPEGPLAFHETPLVLQRLLGRSQARFGRLAPDTGLVDRHLGGPSLEFSLPFCKFLRRRPHGHRDHLGNGGRRTRRLRLLAAS